MYIVRLEGLLTWIKVFIGNGAHAITAVVAYTKHFGRDTQPSHVATEGARNMGLATSRDTMKRMVIMMVPNKSNVYLPNSDNAHRPGMEETTTLCFVQLSSHSDL